MKLLLLACVISMPSYLIGQIEKNHLKIGDTAPQIIGVDQNGKSINTSEILKTNKVLIVFYRGNWCPHCKKHLTSLQEHLEAFTKKGVYVMVVTPETVDRTLETEKKFKTSFSIVHDADNRIMDDYKVSFEVNKANVPKYYSVVSSKVAAYNAENNNVLPVPATYLIDQDGKISYVHYDPDYKKRSDFSEILKSL